MSPHHQGGATFFEEGAGNEVNPGAASSLVFIPGITSVFPGITCFVPAMNKLALLFHSEIRAEVLRLMFGARQKEMYRAEIINQMDFAGRSVEEELEKLVRLELLLTEKDGNRRYYSVNRNHPLYPELHAIVLKTSGLKDLLAETLPAKGIAFAFVFGSVAANAERAESDIDLMIIGTATHRSLAPALRSAGERIGREINPHFWGLEELQRRAAAKDHFLRDILAKPKLFILGTENEFKDLVGGRVAPAAQDEPAGDP
jgi:DNA-binding transcriptional ArsR family regulator